MSQSDFVEHKLLTAYYHPLRGWSDVFDSSSFSPFAARTQQYVKEQFGQADEKVCLCGHNFHASGMDTLHSHAGLMEAGFCTDTITGRLHRAREESRRSETGPPETPPSHVREIPVP